MEVREEKEWENVENFNGPVMTTKQAKLLTFLVNLEPKMPGIMKQVQVNNLEMLRNEKNDNLFKITC